MKFLVILCLLLTICGCSPGQAKTFAGFTFGGGGNTFSAEPCEMTLDGDSGELVAGQPGDPVFLHLEWENAKKASPGDSYDGKKIQLSEADVSVASKGGSSSLKDGHIVLQASSGAIGHGSFDLTTKLEDGREVTIVGSFTATNRP